MVVTRNETWFLKHAVEKCTFTITGQPDSSVLLSQLLHYIYLMQRTNKHHVELSIALIKFPLYESNYRCHQIISYHILIIKRIKVHSIFFTWFSFSLVESSSKVQLIIIS